MDHWSLITCVYILNSVLWCPLRFPHNDEHPTSLPVFWCSVRLYLQLFVGGFMSYLRYLCLLAYSGVQHIFCFFFGLFVFVLCLVYSMLPVSLDCQFLIAPSIFSNIYLITSILACTRSRFKWYFPRCIQYIQTYNCILQPRNVASLWLSAV